MFVDFAWQKRALRGFSPGTHSRVGDPNQQRRRQVDGTRPGHRRPHGGSGLRRHPEAGPVGSTATAPVAASAGGHRGQIVGHLAVGVTSQRMDMVRFHVGLPKLEENPRA